MSRRWGQHFLNVPDIARRIVAWAEFRTDRPVLEIGPGSGSLTQALLEAGYTVVAVEIDSRWVEVLRSRWPDHPRLRVVAGDVLRLDWRDLGLAVPFGVIGNIPYEISSPLVERLIDSEGLWYRAVWTVQREFGERLAARPATAAYGALSVIVQLRWSVRLGFPIPPTAFRPPPRVESVVVRIEPRPEVPAVVRTPAFSDFVHAAFRHRRKTLLNSLARTPWSDRVAVVARCLESMGLPPTVRAEQVPVEVWPVLGAQALRGDEVTG